jgi:hypothetical protein
MPSHHRAERTLLLSPPLPLPRSQMGVTKEVLKAGTAGKSPSRGQTVTVQCTGYVTETGKKFWSTADTGPFSFRLGVKEVIRAWDEGVATMTLGEKARLVATHDYAYGEPTPWQRAWHAAHWGGGRGRELALTLPQLQRCTPPPPTSPAAICLRAGEAGFPAWGIPPRATLTFDVELVSYA